MEDIIIMYWDEKTIKNMCRTHVHKNFKIIYETQLGRFYFYFKEYNKREISGRVVFFPSF
jgi:hypothetical protein